MEKEKPSSLSSDSEGQKIKKRSKLAIWSFIISLVPILLIIFYGAIRNILFSVPVMLLWYNLMVQVIPFISLLVSIIAIILIKRKKIKGIGFAISALVISIIEAILFLTIINRIG